MISPTRRIMIQTLSICVFCFFAVNLRGQEAEKLPYDYSKEAFVIQQILNKLKFENDGTYTVDTTIQVRVQSASGIQAWGLIQLPYASNEGDAAITKVKVTKPEGTVVSTPLDSIRDMPAPITVQAPFYSDLEIKQVAVKGLEVGDTLEFEQLVRTRNPLVPGQFWFERDFFKNGIVLDEQLEIRVPRDRYVKVQSPKFAPNETEEDGYHVYLWKTANLERPTEDENSKAGQSRKDTLPDVQVTSFRSWDEVAQWYQQLEASRIAPTPEIKAKAEELTRTATSDNDKVRLLYNYVATKFRYIGIAFGIGRYQPHAAADVLANGYGDCKDKHTLLAALLNAAGVHSSAVLINSSRKIDPDVPSPGQFDHLITAIPQGKDLLWLDSTEEVAPAGYLFSVLRDKQALAVPDTGAGQLIRTPADPPFASSFIFKIDGKIGSDSVLEAKVDSSFRGDVEYAFRAAFRSVSQTQWKDVGEAIARAWSFSGTVSDVEVGSPEATEKPFSFKYVYQRKDYPNWPDVLRPPLPPLNVHKLADDDKSSDPIKLESPGEYRLEADVELPKDTVAKPHASVDISKDFAEYHASYSWQSGVLHVQRRLTIRMREIPRARGDEYRAFWKILNDDADVVLPISSSVPVSSEKGSGTSVESPDARANQLLDLGDSLFRQGDYDDAIAQFRKALSLRADDVRAHRTLGDVLFNKNDLDGAITEYREALRLNPQDARAHKTLGDVLTRKEDRDGAIAQYREALRIDPADAEAHHGLGHVLLENGDSPSALKEFQENVRLKPSDAEAHYNLGVALNSNNDTNGAIAEYREALHLNPQDTRAHRALGDALWGEEDRDGAIAQYREASRIDPTDVNAHRSLGDALYYTGDFDKAETEYREALRVKPDDADTHRGLGDVLLFKDDRNVEAAIAEYREAVRLKPDAAEAHNSLGEALVEKRDLSGAMTEYREALRLKPDDSRAHLGMGEVLVNQGHPEQAIEELKKSASESPAPGLFLYELLATAYTSLHRYEEALETWREAEKRTPAASVSGSIATLLIEQKRYKEAVAELQPSIEKNPKNARLEFMLGRALLRAGEAEKSMAVFQKAVELDSSPGMLNGVSYELAVANVHLDAALGYAEQAVTQHEDKAAAIYLADLTPADLRIMPALAAEWDTLGWVHYRFGHMDEAEKYISAAWKLAQFPDIGDHLGVIYEKTGKKDQAIQLYKMTLATRHAPEETMQRLSALSGSRPSDQEVNAAVDDLMRLRTIKLPRLSKGRAHAEFFIVLTPGAGLTGVKFISGSEELRGATAALASAHYDVTSPDNVPVKLVRRGILDCPAAGTNCEFVLLPPESVNSVN